MPSHVRPVRVYLDSSDYSVMSDPVAANAVAVQVRDQLRRWVRDGDITCHFSGTLICEIAPLGSGATDAARRRADLVADLCGQHAMISQDRLLDAEVRFALRQRASRPEVVSSSAEWFPLGADEVSPAELYRVQDEVREMIAQEPMNRSQRREATRRLLRKDGRIRSSGRNALVKNTEAFLAQYPLGEAGAEAFRRYVLGEGTRKDVDEALMQSLRDPRWMMLWFARQPDLATPFTRWIRGPGEHLASLMETMRELAEGMRAGDEARGTDHHKATLSRESWERLCDDCLLRIARRIAGERLALDSSRLDLATIKRDCPGLSIGVRALYSAWRQSTLANPRTPLGSDYPDALHAMYAPYVDVFRADRFMAAHIRGWAAPWGTAVVSKLSELVAVIAFKLDHPHPDFGAQEGGAGANPR